MTVLCCYFPVIAVKVRSQTNLKFPCFCNVLRGYTDRKERGWRGCLQGETDFWLWCVYDLKCKFKEVKIIFFFSGNPLILTEFILVFSNL